MPEPTSRFVALAVLIAVAAVVVTVGVAMVSEAAGVIAGGLLLAGWAWLVFGDVT